MQYFLGWAMIICHSLRGFQLIILARPRALILDSSCWSLCRLASTFWLLFHWLCCVLESWLLIAFVPLNASEIERESYRKKKKNHNFPLEYPSEHNLVLHICAYKCIFRANSICLNGEKSSTRLINLISPVAGQALMCCGPH